MAERKLKGSDILFKVDHAGGTSYDTVVCQTDGSFGISVNEIDAGSKCGPDKQPGTADYNLSIDGQIMFDPNAGRVSTGAIFTAAKAKTIFTWTMGPATPVADDIVYSGSGFYSKLDTKYGQDDVATFSATVGVVGEVTQTITP